MNYIQEVLNLLERKQKKKSIDLKRDWFQFGRTKPSSVRSNAYVPKMDPYAIRFDDLKCNIISGLVEGTGTEFTLPMWSTVNTGNCNVQKIIDSIYSQDSAATQGLVSGDFRVTGDTVIEGNLLVNGTQTIIESTVVQVADNIFRINSGGASVDAGIEVVQPSGLKTFLWDTVADLWTTGGNNLNVGSIIINNQIQIDGQAISNITTEAEGLNAEDNDTSLPTTAAVKDYVDAVSLNIKELNYGGSSNVVLTTENLAFEGTGNQIKILLSEVANDSVLTFSFPDDIFVTNSVTTVNLHGQSLFIDGEQVTSFTTSAEGLSSEYNDNSLPTTKAVIDYINAERDYVSNVTLTGTNLDITGVNNAFTGTINLNESLLTSADVLGGLKLTATQTIVGGIPKVIIDHDTITPSVTTNSVSLNYGDNFTVKNIASVDSTGHVETITNETYTLPAPIQTFYAKGIVSIIDESLEECTKNVIGVNGEIEIIFDTPVDSIDYTVVATSGCFGNSPANEKAIVSVSKKTVNGFTLQNYDVGIGNPNGNVVYDFVVYAKL